MRQFGQALPFGGPLLLHLLVALHGPALSVGVKRAILKQPTLPIDVDRAHHGPLDVTFEGTRNQSILE
jgi:hypothetical protein